MTQDDPRILELRRMREQARIGGGADRVAKQHAKGKLTARERSGTAARSRHVQRTRTVHHPSRRRDGPGHREVSGRRRDHRLRPDRWAHGVRVRAGLHRLRRHAQRNAEPQDLPRHGSGAAQRRAHHRPHRFRRRAHSRGRAQPGRLRRNLPPQRADCRASSRRSASCWARARAARLIRRP